MTSLANILNNDLLKIDNWAYKCKMNFKPDPAKKAQEVIFSRKINKPSHPDLIFNNNQVIHALYQKGLGMILEMI